MNTPNNRRRKESRERLEKVFVELLQSRDLSQISVSELCKRAGLNRTTFYANYTDIYGLADSIRDRLEESLAELEQKNGKVLRFTVSNAVVAAQLLQQEMGVRDVVVESEQELTIRDLRLDTGAAVRRFVEAGLVVSDAHLYEDTLEDYFKRITGGEGIA